MLSLSYTYLQVSRFLLLLSLFLHTGCGETAPSTPFVPPKDTTSVPIGEDSLYLPGRVTGMLEDSRLVEISGIAPSRERDDVLWVHNDSGDEPRLLAIDTSAGLLAEIRVSGAANVDWEDIASASINGKSWLYIADTGDNGKSRKRITVYRCAEPRIETSWHDTTIFITPESMLLSYPDGERDCEALFVDARDESVYLITKTGDDSSEVFSKRWQAGSTPVILDHAGYLRIPALFAPLRLVTAADLAADGSAALVRTYTAIYEYRSPAEPVLLFARSPRSLPGLTAQPQAEALCYSRDARGIWTVSEGQRQPLIFIARRQGT